MRLEVIRAAAQRFANELQPLPPDDISDQIVGPHRISPTEALRRRAVRRVALPILQLRQPAVRLRARVELPFQHDLVCIGDRFFTDASLARLLNLLRSERIEKVLIPGCYLGSGDVQFWLRRGVSRLQGIDVNSLAKRWATIVPELKSTFGTDVEFRQASIEKIPFKDEEFDLVASSAVVEHVRNIEAMVAETARVLRPGGWAWHDFGPLYFTFGGDHCIAAFGPSAGYDHLLLNEDAYRARLADQAFFDKHEDPNLPFWARKDQFSFLEPSAYLQHFARHFEVAHVVVKISRDALRFRKEEPRAWKQLLDAGLSEATLLTSGLAVILKKR